MAHKMITVQELGGAHPYYLLSYGQTNVSLGLSENMDSTQRWALDELKERECVIPVLTADEWENLRRAPADAQRFDRKLVVAREALELLKESENQSVRLTAFDALEEMDKIELEEENDGQ